MTTRPGPRSVIALLLLVATGWIAAPAQASSPAGSASAASASPDAIVGAVAAPPSRAAARTRATASLAVLDEPIVSVSQRAPAPPSRPRVLQVTDGEPLVAASGAPAGARPARLRRAQPVRPAPPVGSRPGGNTLAFARAAAPVLSVSVPLVGVVVGSATRPRHGGSAPPRPAGPAAVAVALHPAAASPFGSGPVEPRSGAALFADGPSSSSGAGAPALELIALTLAGVVLLGWLAAPRRTWELPIFTWQSALLFTGPDRPG